MFHDNRLIATKKLLNGDYRMVINKKAIFHWALSMCQTDDLPPGFFNPHNNFERQVWSSYYRPKETIKGITRKKRLSLFSLCSLAEFLCPKELLPLTFLLFEDSGVILKLPPCLPEPLGKNHEDRTGRFQFSTCFHCGSQVPREGICSGLGFAWWSSFR